MSNTLPTGRLDNSKHDIIRPKLTLRTVLREIMLDAVKLINE